MKTTGKPATEHSHAATAIIEDSPGGGAFLSVKICSDEQHAAALWDESVLECALVRDLALTSGGLPSEQQGPFFVSRFNSAQSAALAARRMQWAVQGFSDSGMTRPSLTVLIQSGEDVAQSGFDNQALDEAEGGRILVAGAAAKSLGEVPAFVLKSYQGGNSASRELAWRAAESRTTREADEDALARFIEQTGRAAYRDADAAGAQAAANLLSQQSYQVEDFAETDEPPRSRKMLWIGLGSAAAVIGVTSFLFLQPGNREKNGAPPATQESSPSPISPAQAAMSATTTNSTAGGVDKKPQPTVPRPSKHVDPKPKEPTPQVVDTPQPPRVTGSCQYSADQIPGLISMAENSRARRQYKDAQRKLQAVLSCEPGNGRAKEELELVRQAQAAEGGSSDQ